MHHMENIWLVAGVWMACAGVVVSFSGRQTAASNHDDDAAGAVLLPQSRTYIELVPRLPIAQAQYTALVTVVILTAVVPTAIAQLVFKPAEEPEEMEAEVP